MPKFRYKAVALDGGLLEGEITADSNEAVIKRLRDLGHTPILAQESITVAGLGGKGLAGRIRPRLHLGPFTRDLASLLKAGVPLDQALEKLADLSPKEDEAGLLRRLLADVREGALLSEAMAAQPNAFGPFYLSMVRAGEAGGALAEVLARLAEFIKQQDELKEAVKTALIYPAILVGLTLVSLIILMTFVVPQFTTLFEEMGQELPLMSRIVFGIGKAFQDFWWLMPAVAIALPLYFRLRLKRPAYRYRWDGRLLGLPLFGDLITKVQLSLFSRMLGTLLTNGVPLLNALSVAKDTLGNQVLKEVVNIVEVDVKGGMGVSDAFMKSGRFPMLAMHMLRVGEDTGRLAEMLFELAETYDGEVRTAIRRLLTLLEPVLIIGLGLVIGAIIMAMLIAVLSVNELAF